MSPSPPPLEELRAMLLHVSASSIADAVANRHGHPAHILDFVSPTPGAVLFGPAVTIRYFPARRDLIDPVAHDLAALFYRAIADGGEGRVVVLSSGGHPDAALGGSRKLSRLGHTRVAGLLADGRLRDFDELATGGFVSYCRGETVQRGMAEVMPLEANVPVEVAGVGVVPGDYVYADRSGVVIIPAASVAEVLTDAAAFEERDAASIARSRTEDPATIMAHGDPR